MCSDFRKNFVSKNGVKVGSICELQTAIAFCICKVSDSLFSMLDYGLLVKAADSMYLAAAMIVIFLQRMVLSNADMLLAVFLLLFVLRVHFSWMCIKNGFSVYIIFVCFCVCSYSYFLYLYPSNNGTHLQLILVFTI